MLYIVNSFYDSIMKNRMIEKMIKSMNEFNTLGITNIVSFWLMQFNNIENK